jgi:dipeptidyl aminopeptidase/acylaminoacyl peptidase
MMLAALALFAGSASAFASPPESSPPAKIPIERFAALPVLTRPILSPDGHRIAARSTSVGNVTIMILDADHPEAPARGIAVGKARIAALTWAGNDRLLLTIRASEKLAGGYDLPFLRLIAVDIATGSSRIVDRGSHGTFAGDVLYTDPTGAWALVASQDDDYSYPSVKHVDLATGKATQVEKAREGVWDWYADDNGVVRAGVTYDNRKWTVWYRDKPEEKLRPIRGKIDKDDDSSIDKFIFRGANSWVVTNERTGRFALYKYDVTTGTIGAPIYEHPQVDVEDVFYDESTGAIKAVKFETDRTHIEWLDPDMKALQGKLDRALPAESNVAVGWSDDEKRTLVWSSSGSDPGRYFLLDRTSSRMHAVVDPYPDINPAQMAEVQSVQFRTRDGLMIPAYLTLPKGREAKGLPLILMPHGGPYERDHWEYDPLVQFLANRGYAVLQPQFRGSTGYGKDFVAKGYGEWGRKMQDDLDDGVDWLARTGQIDPKRVCIVGASYGGYAALWGAIRNPERYRCAASLAGVSDLPAMLRYDRKLFSAVRYFKEWRSKVDGEGTTDLAAVSPVNFASRLTIPVLIGHGEEDDNVLPKQSHEMVDALNQAHANVTSVFYKDDSHGWDNAADFADWLRRLEAFLAKYNPA